MQEDIWRTEWHQCCRSLTPLVKWLQGSAKSNFMKVPSYFMNFSILVCYRSILPISWTFQFLCVTGVFYRFQEPSKLIHRSSKPTWYVAHLNFMIADLCFQQFHGFSNSVSWMLRSIEILGKILLRAIEVILQCYIKSMLHIIMFCTTWEPYTICSGVHSLLYFAYTCVRDLFIGGVIYLAKNYKVMIFYIYKKILQILYVMVFYM
jgi:hypothetical protein